MSTGLIAMRSPRNRLYKVVYDQRQQAPPDVQPEDRNYGREVQREATEVKRRQPASQGHHDRVDHRAHRVVEDLEEAVRRIAREPAKEYPGDDEPEKYIERVVDHGHEQFPHAEPERLKRQHRIRQHLPY